MDKQLAYQALMGELKTLLKDRAWDGSQKFVPGEGSLSAELLFVGEAPGAVEDKLGRPFVGPAGKLFEELLLNLGWSRSEVYITNILKFRPPENRDPSLEEISLFRPYLLKELSIVKPLLVVILGRYALSALLPDQKLSAIRGQALRRGQFLYYVTYHPAAALHNPTLKETLVHDFNKLPLLIEKIKSGELSLVSSSLPPSQKTLF